MKLFHLAVRDIALRVTESAKNLRKAKTESNLIVALAFLPTGALQEEPECRYVTQDGSICAWFCGD